MAKLRALQGFPGGFSSLRSSLSITHPPALITIGGEEAAPGAAGSPRSPRGAAGGGRGSGHRRCPQPSASSPGSTSPSCFCSSCFFSCRFHMGNLLKVLTYNELDQGPNFFLDFESEMGFLFSVFRSVLNPEFHIHTILSSLSPVAHRIAPIPDVLPHLCHPGVSPGRGARPVAGGCRSSPLPPGLSAASRGRGDPSW